jgi:D-lactate dehydrogenase
MTPLARELERLLAAEDLLLDPSDCWSYGADNSKLHAMPDAVAFVRDGDMVRELVRLCRRLGVPVTARGRGTGTTGAVVPDHGGLILSFERMNRIIEVEPDNRWLIAEPGVTNAEVQRAAGREGFFWPPDPTSSAYCTIGGNLAYNSAGPHAAKYGTPRDNTLGLAGVAGSGDAFRTGVHTTKGVVGYDLTRLLVGSEGTLGVITELRLKVHGIPEAISSAVCSFATLEGAVATVIESIQAGVPVARIELLDEVQMQACIDFSKLEGFTAAPTLFFEFHGSTAGVAEQAETAKALAEANGGGAFHWASRAEDRNRLWQARHDVYYAALGLRPGAKAIATDVCVPISKLADAVTAARRDIDASGLIAPIVGHVGDGNFHVQLMVDPDDADEMRRAQAINARMVDRALAVGGTCTGEHGVGIGKMDKVEKEHPTAVPYWRAIKHALDPLGLMNPGKIFRPD